MQHRFTQYSETGFFAQDSDEEAGSLSFVARLLAQMQRQDLATQPRQRALCRILASLTSFALAIGSSTLVMYVFVSQVGQALSHARLDSAPS